MFLNFIVFYKHFTPSGAVNNSFPKITQPRRGDTFVEK